MSTEQAFNLRGISVFIDMPVLGNIPPETVMSLVRTIDLLKSKGIPYSFDMQVDGDICESRSIAAAKFLASGFSRLLFIDADMEWEAEDALRLIAMSTKMDIVVGPYTTRKAPVSFLIKLKDANEIPVNEYGCMAIDGAGLGFCAISRRVIEVMSPKYPVVHFLGNGYHPHIFRRDDDVGKFRTEDIAFFADAKEAGFQCWMDPEIVLGHIGKNIFKASLSDHIERCGDVMRVIGAESGRYPKREQAA